MGLIRRKTSGYRFAGSKLNVPGQGIYVVKDTPQDPVSVRGINPTPEKRPTPTPSPKPPVTPTPTPSITPTLTPTPTITLTLTPTPTITQTPEVTPTPTITPSPTPIEICYLATEDLNPIIAENLDNLIVDCPEPAPEIIDAILIDGGSEYLIPGSGEYLSFVDP